MTSKMILIVGDVLGEFETFFKKVKLLKEMGKTDLVLCAGSFFSFGDKDISDARLVYIAQEFDCGVPIYVLGPLLKSQRRYYEPLFTKSLLPNPTFEEGGYDLAVNVTYLGKKGVYTTVDGIKIAYLSGVESDDTTDCGFNLSDIDEMINKCSASGRIDILLTATYPYHVNETSMGGKTNYLNRVNDNGSRLVSKLAKFILPRYHFSSSAEEMWEREPYRNHLILSEQPKLVTRFISLAKVRENEKKNQKWAYAIKLIPARDLDRNDLIKQPDETTENPYLNIDFDKLRASIKKEPDTCENVSFRFDTSSSRNDSRQNHRNDSRQNNLNDNRNGFSNRRNGEDCDQSNKRPATNDQPSEKRLRPSDSQCWFCLTSTHLEKHLLLIIGDLVYLTLAKGGLVENHFLIVPISHKRSIAELELSQGDSNILDEIGRFKNAIIDYFNSKDLVPVFFERNFKSGHLQLQAVAVPRSKASSIEQVLYEECQKREYRLYEIGRGRSLSDELGGCRPYFYIEFQGRRFFIGIKVNRGFAMHFGRELLSHEKLLDCPDRINWRNCELDIDQVRQIVVDIRKEFKPFDFTDS